MCRGFCVPGIIQGEHPKRLEMYGMPIARQVVRASASVESDPEAQGKSHDGLSGILKPGFDGKPKMKKDVNAFYGPGSDGRDGVSRHLIPRRKTAGKLWAGVRAAFLNRAFAAA